MVYPLFTVTVPAPDKSTVPIQVVLTLVQWIYLEQEYPNAGAKTDKPRRWFRGNMTTDQLFALHAESRGYRKLLLDPEENGGCSESCEFLPTDDK
jgi:hypothetical protein